MGRTLQIFSADLRRRFSADSKYFFVCSGRDNGDLRCIYRAFYRKLGSMFAGRERNLRRSLGVCEKYFSKLRQSIRKYTECCVRVFRYYLGGSLGRDKTNFCQCVAVREKWRFGSRKLYRGRIYDSVQCSNFCI